ncbi:MAG: class I SAM-dependent methyltransferase [Pseudolabrys sp.]
MRRVVTYFVNIIGRALGRDGLWMSMQATRLSRRLEEAVWGVVESVVTFPARRKLAPVVNRSHSAQANAVDRHWQAHTIRGRFFLKRQDSLDYIELLTDGRPYKRQLLRLHGPHTGKTILDYGCGPGNDLAGFAEFSGAARIIGIDISERALRLARARVSWHTQQRDLVEFIKIRDGDTGIPLADQSVDYIQSLGVIHHTSRPDKIFQELARVLKPGGEVRIMLYNADSVHVQLTIGYQRLIVAGLQSGLTPEQAFERSADLEAPIAHCVRPPDVSKWVADSGLA